MRFYLRSKASFCDACRLLCLSIATGLHFDAAKFDLLGDRFVTRLFGLTLVLVTFAGTASASHFDPFPSFKDPHFRDPKPAISAPEIDPASALSGLTMLLGGLAVVRGRRSK
jgi:hypothetical protein